MQIPASTMLLLAAASIAVIAGQFLKVQVARTWGLLFYAIMLLAAAVLTIDPVFPANSHDSYTNDALAQGELWLALGFGVLAGIAMVDARGGGPSTLSLYGCLLFAQAVLMLVARVNDFLSLGLAFELLNFVLVGLERSTNHAVDALPGNNGSQPSLKLWNGTDWLSSGLLWLGIAFLISGTGTTNFESVRLVLTQAFESAGEHESLGAPSKLLLLSVGLITCGFFVRLGLVPFQLGHASLAHGRCMALSGFSILARHLAGAMALTRLFGMTFVGFSQALVMLTLAICLASFAVTALMVVRGHSPGVKSISDWIASLMLLQSAWYCVGLMAIAMELEHPASRWGTFEFQHESLAICLFIQLTNLLSGAGMFWTVSHLSRADRDALFVEDFKGLLQFGGVAAFVLIISMSSAIAVPFTAGFWGRWMTLLIGSSVHIKPYSLYLPHAGVRWALLTGVLAMIPCSVAVIRLAREIFLEAPLARPTAVGGRGPLVAGTIAAGLILLLGIAPQIVFNPLRNFPPPRAKINTEPKQGSGHVPMGQFIRP